MKYIHKKSKYTKRENLRQFELQNAEILISNNLVFQYNFSMTIYIEEFLIQNIIINFCILRLLYISTRYKTQNCRLVLSSILGAVFSVISAMFLSNIVYVNIIKLVCSLLMILIAFNVNFKQFIFSYILLFIYTHALGGAMMSFASNTYFSSSGIIMQSKVSLEIVTLIIIGLTYIFELSLKHTKNKILNNNFIFKIQLKLGKKILKIKAFIDTGNNLSFNGQSVVILDNTCFLKLIDLNYFASKNKIRISTNTITGKKNLDLFLIDEIKIFSKKTKIIKNQYIAVDKMNSFSHTDYQALLSPAII